MQRTVKGLFTWVKLSQKKKVVAIKLHTTSERRKMDEKRAKGDDWKVGNYATYVAVGGLDSSPF